MMACASPAWIETALPYVVGGVVATTAVIVGMLVWLMIRSVRP